MKHASFGAMPCPVARSLEHVGEWWSMLILRDALHGYKRFDEFEQSLGIAPGILARRLKTLVEAGMLERRQYTAKPPRYEYLVTDRCRDFETVLHSLLAFGNRHFSPGERNVVIVDSQTGVEAEPVLIDSRSGRPLSDPRFQWAAGPAADAEVQRRYAKASA
ncbi:MAG: helix-turn-helix domain-containing protein [Rhizobium sp.]|nr:helix-turn-helix domain-containing protein [Rhizobium sp.]